MTLRSGASLIIFTITMSGCANVERIPPAVSADRSTSVQLASYAGLLRSVTVTVAGVTYPFIFDTGGGETVVTPELASRMGCTPYGRAVGFRMGGEQVSFQYCDDVALEIGNVPISHDRVGVFDLRAILPRDAPPAEGVISLRSFRNHPVTIELASGKLTLETPRSLAARTTSMLPLMIRVATGPTGAETTVYIAARVNGERVWFLLDSGNGDAALVSRYVARSVGLQSDKGDMLIDFEGLGSHRLPVGTRNMIYDGALGAGFMQDWILTVDLKSTRAWAVPTTKPGSWTR